MTSKAVIAATIAPMSQALKFHDVHLSDAIQGVVATVREGVFTYKLFVSVEALRERGASSERSTWVGVFHANETEIATIASVLHRKKPNAATFIATFAGS